MIIVSTTSYPPEGANEMGKRFLALKPLPSYITMKGPYVLAVKDDGIQTLALYECEKSKLADSFEAIGNRYTAFYGVPGFTNSIQVWLDIGEALKMIGLA
jgi:hypothetical protein